MNTNRMRICECWHSNFILLKYLIKDREMKWKKDSIEYTGSSLKYWLASMCTKRNRSVQLASSSSTSAFESKKKRSQNLLLFLNFCFLRNIIESCCSACFANRQNNLTWSLMFLLLIVLLVTYHVLMLVKM